MIKYNQKDYRTALGFFQTALQSDPNHVPDIRLGIGLCFGKLKMQKESRYAFERVLERVTPDSTL
jgi:TolA-binding protein